MNPYIEKVESAIWNSKDTTGLEPAHLNELRVTFIEPTKENKYHLSIDQASLINDQGLELPYAQEQSLLLPTVTYPSKCTFRFELEREGVELLDGAVFEIKLHKTGPNPIETIRYILTAGQWEEITEESL